MVPSSSSTIRFDDVKPAVPPVQTQQEICITCNVNPASGKTTYHKEDPKKCNPCNRVAIRN